MTHLPNGGNRCVRASAVPCGGNAVGVLSPVCRRQLSPGLSYHRLDVRPEPPRDAECFHEAFVFVAVLAQHPRRWEVSEYRVRVADGDHDARLLGAQYGPVQIGRASCRERVEMWGGSGSWRKKR